MTVAIRQQRYRERQKAGRMVVQIEIDELNTVEVLEANHLLPAGGEHSQEDIQRAVQTYIDLSFNSLDE
jgi:hypothetical protein